MNTVKPKRIILSRKGFDSTAGGIASPIMPDGTLLSMPIPAAADGEFATYGSLTYKGHTYADILSDLHDDPWICEPKAGCHLDPDIRENVRKRPLDKWKPAFGPRGAERGPKGALRDVAEGDLFLFFGWFKQVKHDDRGHFKYGIESEDDKRVITQKRGGKKPRDLHVIHSYMQVGEVLEDKTRIKAEYGWHPHSRADRLANGLFLPSTCIWFDKTKPGCGVLDYDDCRVLTADGKVRSIWEPRPFLMPDMQIGHLSSRKNSGDKGELRYTGRWQELVFTVEGNEGILEYFTPIGA